MRRGWPGPRSARWSNEFCAARGLRLGGFQLRYDARRCRRQLTHGLWDQRVLFIAQANVVDVSDSLVKNFRDVVDQFGARSGWQFSPGFRILLQLLGAGSVRGPACSVKH